MPFSPARTSSRKSRRGMTLIEILLALSIAILVVAVVLSMYQTVSATASGQNRRKNSAEMASSIRALLIRDFSTAVAPAEDKLCTFTLGPDEAGFSKIAFAHTRTEEGETDARWFTIEQVAYQIVEAASSTNALVRIRRPILGPGALEPAETNVIAAGVQEFQIRAYDGADWYEKWPQQESSATPQAVSLALGFQEGGKQQRIATEIMIPVGNPFFSSFKRSGTTTTSP